MHQITLDPLHPPPTTPAINQIMSAMFHIDDMELLDLFHELRATARLLDLLVLQYQPDEPLSAARMRLLVRLAVDQRAGNTAGISPSALSRFLGVSRNTTSALLNGLEEQGLIERHLHPTDRRQFLIRVTSTGQDLVDSHAPRFAAFIASLFAPLSAEERAGLLVLLHRLNACLLDRSAELGLHIPPIETAPAVNNHNQP